MTTLINHYSALFGAVLIVGLTAYGLLKDGFTPRDGVILALVTVGLLAAWLIFRPKPGERGGQAQLEAQLGQGVPVLLELQSPY